MHLLAANLSVQAMVVLLWPRFMWCVWNNLNGSNSSHAKIRYTIHHCCPTRELPFCCIYVAVNTGSFSEYLQLAVT